jgi:alpha-beta hydrolase superfamily lysophospholipase
MFTATRADAPEEPLRVRREGAELHAVLHRAAGQARGAVLVCAPDGEERAWALRPFVQLARDLAARGLHVLRFDYEGQGESSGAYEDTDVDSRLRDIAAASCELRARTRTTRIAIVAARLGGALALEAAAADPAVQRLALWEPVLDVEGYLRNLLRVHVASQMVVHKKVMRTSEQLLADIAGGGTVSINGYKHSRSLVAGLQRMTAGEWLTAVKIPAFVVALPGTKIPESGAEIRRQSFAPFWKEPRGDMTPPPSLLSEIAGWIDAGGEKDGRK